MKKVYQTRHGLYGDCMPACVASILEISTKGMPRIKATSTNWLPHWQKFLKPYGLGLQWYYQRGCRRPKGYAIAAHRVRGRKWHHAVVYHNGRKVHDPFPKCKLSRSILGIEYWMVFTVLDPSKFAKRRPSCQSMKSKTKTGR